jgi:multidrug resistance protein MdtO
MSADARLGWQGFLRAELRVDRARWSRMAIMTGCATLLATLFLVFRVPLPAYGAYVVLMAAQRDVATSVTVSLGALAAAVAAMALSFLLYLVDIDEPAVRVPAMAVAMFGAMYLSRLPRVGPLFFLSGFLLVVTQTLIDQIPDAEALTHLLLWLLLLVASACTLVPLVELLVGRRPAAVFDDGMREHGLRAAAHLAGQRPPPLTVSLGEMAGLAARLGAAATHRLATMLQMEQAASLCAGARGHDEALVNGQVRALNDEMAEPRATARAPLPPLPGNPTHITGLRFAFKATLAAMLCYIIYSGLDWSGIRTSIITCFFVALSSTGETIHKLGLRLTGALIGGVLAGVSIVFLFPVLDDIGGFIVLFAAVTLLCTWVATSSPLLAYAGLQMAFAFYLGVLQDAGPTDDLTVLRDRLAGIVLGNIAMSLVFSMLWPVSALASARAVLSRVVTQHARLAQRATPPADADVIAAAVGLEEASRLARLASFEPDRTARPGAMQALLARFVPVAAWSSVWLATSPSAEATDRLASRLMRVADGLQGAVHDHTVSLPSAVPGAPESLERALRAFEQEAADAR